MGIEEEIFSKTKTINQDLAIWKNLHIHDAPDHYVFLYIFTACLHCMAFANTIKDDRSEGL